MGLSGQVQIRRNRKIASYLFAKVGESISLSQGLGTKERAGEINHVCIVVVEIYPLIRVP